MEKKNVPKLRFPEFEGEWFYTRLGEISDDVAYGIGASATKFDGVNKYLRITDIDEECRRFIPNPLTSPEGDNFLKYRLKNGDIVFARTGASVGKSYLYKPEDGILIYAGFLIKFHITKAIPQFIYLMTFRSDYHKWVKVFSVRSGQPGLNAEEYKNWAFFLPPKPEQQKIASFLSAVDKKIEQLTRKKELLEQYKKGVMQKLFPKPGEKHPKLRFKDENGKDFPDWEVKRLEEITKMVKRKTDKPIKDILTISAGNGFLRQEDRFNQVIAGTSLDKYTHLKKKEFSYNRGNSKSFTYGCIYQLKELDEALVPNIYRSFTLLKGEHKFFEHLFLSKFLDRQLRRLISSSARMDGLLNINQDDFYKCTIPFPPVKEQKVISQFIDSIDDRIEISTLELKKAQTFKKGLLQQMFV